MVSALDLGPSCLAKVVHSVLFKQMGRDDPEPNILGTVIDSLVQNAKQDGDH